MEDKKIVVPVQLYKAQNFTNCLVNCYLMTRLAYESDFDASKEENRIHKILGKNVSTLSMIKLFHDSRYTIRIFSEKDYRLNYVKNDKLKKLVKDYVNYVDEFHIKETVGIIPTEKLLKSCLKNGEVLLANGEKDGRPHMRLIFGYSGESFLIADPSLSKIITTKFLVLEKILQAPEGYWMVSVKYK